MLPRVLNALQLIVTMRLQQTFEKLIKLLGW